MEVNLLNTLMLQLLLNTIIELLALFKLILYSNLLKIINVALYFTFNSIIFLKKINLKKKMKSRPTDPISNHKATRNKHIFLFWTQSRPIWLKVPTVLENSLNFGFSLKNALKMNLSLKSS